MLVLSDSHGNSTNPSFSPFDQNYLYLERLFWEVKASKLRTISTSENDYIPDLSLDEQQVFRWEIAWWRPLWNSDKHIYQPSVDRETDNSRCLVTEVLKWVTASLKVRALVHLPGDFLSDDTDSWENEEHNTILHSYSVGMD